MDIFQIIVKFNELANRQKPMSTDMIISPDNTPEILSRIETELFATIRTANQLLTNVKNLKNDTTQQQIIDQRHDPQN